LVKEANMVVVATCDTQISEAVENEGGIAIMTKSTHERCTDRIHEAIDKLPGDIIVMVQGDEPLLIPHAVSALVKPLLDDPSLPIVNLLSPLESDKDYSNSNIVKAACNVKGDIMFFSRTAIPFFRTQVKVPVYRQTGIMAFRRAALNLFSNLPATPLEQAESVDMFRAIEHGMRIYGVMTDYSTVGVDRPEDVTVVEEILKDNKVQKNLFSLIYKK